MDRSWKNRIIDNTKSRWLPNYPWTLYIHVQQHVEKKNRCFILCYQFEVLQASIIRFHSLLRFLVYVSYTWCHYFWHTMNRRHISFRIGVWNGLCKLILSVICYLVLVGYLFGIYIVTSYFNMMLDAHIIKIKK